MHGSVHDNKVRGNCLYWKTCGKDLLGNDPIKEPDGEVHDGVRGMIGMLPFNKSCSVGRIRPRLDAQAIYEAAQCQKTLSELSDC
jgi:hypothetical protein